MGLKDVNKLLRDGMDSVLADVEAGRPPIADERVDKASRLAEYLLMELLMPVLSKPHTLKGALKDTFSSLSPHQRGRAVVAALGQIHSMLGRGLSLLESDAMKGAIKKAADEIVKGKKDK